MPMDPNTYAGYPDAEVQFGVPLRTGLAGPSKVGDYQWAVFDQNGNMLTDPNMVLPPGTDVSFGYPARNNSATGGEVVTGTDLVEQAERIRASQDASRIAQEQVNLQREQMAQQNAQFQQNFQMQQADAQRRYELDKAMLGEQTAMRLFQERIQTANLELQRNQAKLQEQQFQLERQQAEFARADQVAARKMDVLNMLAERSGPQDWVAYNNLLNGLSAPDPQATQTIDVMSLLKDIEGKAAMPAAGGGSIDWGNGLPAQQSSTPAPLPNIQTSGVVNPNAGGAGSAGQPATQGVAPPAQDSRVSTVGITKLPTSTVPPGTYSDIYKSPTGANPALIPTQGGALPGGQVWAGSQPQPGPAPKPGQAGYNYLAPVAKAAKASQGGAVTVGPTGRPVPGQPGIHYLEEGGVMGGGTMAVTGESSSGEMNPELVINMNPDPDDKIAVIPLKKLLAALEGQGVPMAEQGGVYPMQESRVSTSADPWGKAIPGQGGRTTSPPGEMRFDVGIDGPGPPPGTYMPPSSMQQQPAPFGQPQQDNSMIAARIPRYTPRPMPTIPQGPSFTPSNTNVDYWRSRFRLPARTYPRNIDIRGMLQALAQRGVPMAENGGVYNVGEDLAAGRQTINRYDPSTLGSQPFIQKLLGQRESTPFRGFGGRLQNAGLGLHDFPTSFNIRNFMNMDESEQLMTQDLYNRGLGVHFGDIYGQSMRAAPFGQSLPTSVYGR